MSGFSHPASETGGIGSGAAICIGDGKADKRGLYGHIFLQEQFGAHFCDIRHRLDNGRAYVIMGARITGPVKTDYLHVFGNSLIQTSEYLQDVIGQAVCDTEDTFKGESAVLNMLFQKSVEFFIRIPVVNDFHFISKVPGQTAVFETCFSFVGLIGQGGARAKKCHVFAAQVRQLFRSQLSSGKIITGNTGGIRTYGTQLRDTWAVRSSGYSPAGSDYISVRMGGHAVAVHVYLADGTEIGYYQQNRFNDANFPGVGAGGSWADMGTYVMDLSAYPGQEMYIVLADEQAEGWAHAFFDEVVTYYETVPDYENNADEVPDGATAEPVKISWQLAENSL